MQHLRDRLESVVEAELRFTHGAGKSDTPRKAGGLMSGAASKAVTR
jgi:hypothetical protein